MQTTPATPWHRTSFDHFLYRGLPELLAQRLHLAGYRAESDGPHTCRVILQTRGSVGEFEVAYPALPAPDAEGVFHVPETLWRQVAAGDQAQPSGCSLGDLVVLPRADRDDPAEARITCVGEQLLEYIDARLGQLPAGTELDQVLLAALAPLDSWFRGFLTQYGQPLRATNWLDRATHLRRLLVLDRQSVFTPGHFGRTCLFETPEGPNIGRILAIARGAEVGDGRLVVIDDSPVGGLGLSAALVPFLEHDDGNRLLMGVNMMRQWRPPSDPEPALVQTGLEPEDAGFWCGRNLLTAFLSWDGYALEDSLVVSRGAAAKLRCPHPLEPGDKLSNRHGTKGVVGCVLPDEEMPRLPDGTPVELVFSLSGVPTRWNPGQLREAALGRVAYGEGRPAIVPPFRAPSDEELRRRLRQAGLPDTGMEVLSDHGVALHRAGTVGWVYWGCTDHLARDKVQACTVPHPSGHGQRVGRMEIEVLRQAGAEVVLRELTNTCDEARPDAAGLAARVVAGPVGQPASASPALTRLMDRLAAVGIGTELGADGLAFRLETDFPHPLELARPVAHPWLPDTALTCLPRRAAADLLRPVDDANQRLQTLLATQAPDPLVTTAHDRLTQSVRTLFDQVLSPPDLQPGARALFSGRAVIVPGPELHLDELGVPEDMAWTLFGPQTARTLGGPEAVPAVEQRSPVAAAALEEVLAASWIILNRAPSVSPTSMLAFRPRLCPGKALRLQPLVCPLLNADFDGDQAAVHVPVTAAAQAQAGEKLSVRGHLQRDPGLIAQIVPGMDALFGLACLSRTDEGRRAIAAVTGRQPELDSGILRREGLVSLLRALLQEQGADVALRVAEELMRLGFGAARREGGSVGPLVGATACFATPPPTDDVDQWSAYHDEVQARLSAFAAYDDEDLGAVCLLSHCGARGSVSQLAHLIGPAGVVRDVHGQWVPIRHGWRQGLTPEEVRARVVGARNALFQLHQEIQALGADHDARTRPPGHGVLARAARADRPGVVFARAAAQGEVDPLTDDCARVLAGIAPGA